MSEAPNPFSRKPFLIELEDDEADPAAAPPVPDAALRGDGQAMQAVAAIATAPPNRLRRFAGWAFGALVTLVLSVAAWDFVTNLLARNALLGWIAVVLVSVVVVAAVLMSLREIAGFARLARLDALRARAETAHAEADLAQARGVTAAVLALYDGRAEAAWGLSRYKERAEDVLDADALLNLTETEVLGPLDALVRTEIEAAARRVALITALVPMALADVAVALFSNLRMIRRIAEIYGGRAGTLGSWKLMRKVFASLVATGAVALTDDLIGSVAGGGVLSKLSRRFGEGVVNGALTARIGIAAMELCRPLPFRAVERPKVSALVSRALAGMLPRGGSAKGTGGQA
ncbi:YcjF family protein [Rhodobacter sp. Har01]|uniref:YcjF family protein n=1 Tax=Rhodobacter sp. Har01 TaxID=2883999 RepID=UPI001D084A87|nr:TIGR01620 family protein [Rhodobacter sp. Har01]MCB6178460.1 YcjF family protein [Rhodobacter sp. Har01]